jgi:tetratricopeptide (TPR) repeat protein
MRTILCLVLFSALASGVLAQSVPPALMVEENGKAQPLGLAKLDVQVQIHGYVAQTTTTMTFSNPYPRVLEGDLYFPLPEGATISGYALDINGRLVDGVAVEKHKGREVFEKVVRQGIDPGLVEWTKGNNFKTRVFPIPAGGTRTVRVEYVSELTGTMGSPEYHLPLAYQQKIAEFSLRIEVLWPAAKPKVETSGLAGLKFGPWHEGLLAEARQKDATLTEELVVKLRDIANAMGENETVMVEKADDGQVYFAIHDFSNHFQTVAEGGQWPPPPKHLVLYWDASGSRAGDHARELGLLTGYFASRRSAPPVRVDLVLLRNAAGQPKSFTISGGDARALIDEIRQEQYDGGTQLGAIAPQPGGVPPDLYLLFSDGISNFGSGEPGRMDAPIYAFSADPKADHAFLRYLAMTSGGQYFNLSTQSDEAVIAALGRPVFSFLSAEADGQQATGIFPAMSQPVGDRFTLVGKLPGEAAQIKLHYGYQGHKPLTSIYGVSRREAVEGTVLRRLWAEKKLAELMVFQKRNEREIVALGKQFGMVTPYTSLIVLDTLEQYVQNEIAPPKSLPEIRDEYQRRIDTVEFQKKKQKADKLAAVLAMWKQRVAWWNGEYKYPKDLKYRGDDGPTAGALGLIGAAPGGGTADFRRAAAGSVARQSFNERSAATPAGAMPAAPSPVAGETSHRRYADRARALDRDSSAPASDEAGVAMNRNAEQRAAPAATGSERSGVPFNEIAGPAATGNQPVAGAPPVSNALAPRAAGFQGQSVTAGLSSAAAMQQQAGQQSEQGGEAQAAREPGIVIKAWNPDTPYLKELKAADPKVARDVYYKNRRQYGGSPAFFLDCADYFLAQHQPEMALQVLSNIAELELEDAALVRILGHRLEQLDYLDLAVATFEQVLALRPEEPQSYRDLALVLARRADERSTPARSASEGPVVGRIANPSVDRRRISNPSYREDYDRALGLLNQVILGTWDGRFPEIELFAVEEANQMLAKAKAAGVSGIPLDPRLIQLLDVDIRIVMTWHADNTDIDLWVTEPSGEKAFYAHNRTTTGGLVSADFTGGYGPEEYMVRRAMHGMYKIQSDYFGSRATQLLGPITVQVDVFTNYGRPNQQHKSLTVRLAQQKQNVAIGEIEF